MRNGSIGSRTHTGAKARHTCLPAATNIRLDRAHLKDAVAAKIEEAPAKVKEESDVGPTSKQLS
jgi:hypothetical protein